VATASSGSCRRPPDARGMPRRAERFVRSEIVCSGDRRRSPASWARRAARRRAPATRRARDPRAPALRAEDEHEWKGTEANVVYRARRGRADQNDHRRSNRQRPGEFCAGRDDLWIGRGASRPKADAQATRGSPRAAVERKCRGSRGTSPVAEAACSRHGGALQRDGGFRRRLGGPNGASPNALSGRREAAGVRPRSRHPRISAPRPPAAAVSLPGSIWTAVRWSATAERRLL